MNDDNISEHIPKISIDYWQQPYTEKVYISVESLIKIFNSSKEITTEDELKSHYNNLINYFKNTELLIKGHELLNQI